MAEAKQVVGFVLYGKYEDPENAGKQVFHPLRDVDDNFIIFLTAEKAAQATNEALASASSGWEEGEIAACPVTKDKDGNIVIRAKLAVQS